VTPRKKGGRYGIVYFGHSDILNPNLFLKKKHKGTFKGSSGGIKNSNPPPQKEGSE